MNNGFFFQPVTLNVFVCLFYRTVLLLVNMLVEYCQCVDDTPMLVTDIMNKLFETLKVTVLCVSFFVSMFLITAFNGYKTASEGRIGDDKLLQ